MQNNQPEGLKRELGVLDVAINVINISIASGIFLLSALIAGILGTASIVPLLAAQGRGNFLFSGTAHPNQPSDLP